MTSRLCYCVFLLMTVVVADARRMRRDNTGQASLQSNPLAFLAQAFGGGPQNNNNQQQQGSGSSSTGGSGNNGVGNSNNNGQSGHTGFSSSTGLSAAGSGFQQQQGLGFDNGKLTIGKNTGIQAAGAQIFGGGDQASVDFSQGPLPNICRQQNLGILGSFLGQQNGGCVNLAPLAQLFGSNNAGSGSNNLNGLGRRRRRLSAAQKVWNRLQLQ